MLGCGGGVGAPTGEGGGRQRIEATVTHLPIAAYLAASERR